ncbi:MAG: hypothetical protein ACLFR6_06790 [Salinarchaeum sp.]
MAGNHSSDAAATGRTTSRRTRRALLGAVGAGGITSLSGCFLFDVRQSPDEDPTEPTEPTEPPAPEEDPTEPTEPTEPPAPEPTSGYLTARTTTVVEELRWTATQYESVMATYDDFVDDSALNVEVGA